MVRRTILALCAVLVFAGCGEIERPLIVGAKGFAEQRITAELVAQTLRAHGIPAELDPTPRDTLQMLRALRQAEIDVYVEYTGSALAMAGVPPIHDVDESLAAAEAEAAAFGLTWGPPLGFHNDFALLVRPGTALAGPGTISALADRPDRLRFGMTREFRERPLDGFDSLVRRYGLRAEPSLVVSSAIGGKAALYAALLDGEIDVAVGFLTDAAIGEFGLVVLEDDRAFFPAYAAAPLTRSALLERRPQIMTALESLAGTVSTEAMREMVAAVTLDSADPFAVAARFLDPDARPDPPGTAGRPVSIAVGDLDARAGQSATVVLALRKTFPGRRVDARRVADPLAALLDGEVRFALVSGASFFEVDEATGQPRQRGLADAVVPVGFDVMHLLVAPGGAPDPWRSGSRLGVGVADGLSARAAALAAAGMAEADATLVPVATAGNDGLREQAAQVAEGELDGVLVMAEVGHPLVVELLDQGLELAALNGWEARGNRVAFPFLQPVMIPAGSYAGQDRAVASFGSQAVIAASRPNPLEAVGVVGPGSAAIQKTLPVGVGTIERIRAALGVEVGLDPSLPIARAISEPPPEPSVSVTPSIIASAVNLLVLGMLVSIIGLYLGGPGRRRAAGRPEAERPPPPGG